MHHLSICSKCGYGHSSDTCVTDDEVVAWFDSQTEEFLAALPGYEDGLTPRRAWNEFFSSSPATEAAPASSPAPVVAGQGEGTNLCGHCGNGLLEEFCHEPPFVRFSCTDCGCGMDKDLNVISQPRVIDVGIGELPANAIVMGFVEDDDCLKYPFGFVRGEGFFKCDRFGWSMWHSFDGLARAIGNRMLEQCA